MEFEWVLCPVCKNKTLLKQREDTFLRNYPLFLSLIHIYVVVVEKHNMPQKGIIHITKTGEVFATVTEMDGVDKDGAEVMYQPVYEIRGLEGATYEIRAAEDIYTPDGTLRAAKGDVVDTITTAANGIASVSYTHLDVYKRQGEDLQSRHT